jgi:predicted nucleic-acid-binding protein
VIALDTNIIVRLLTRDDPAQVRSVVRAIRGRKLWLAKTMVLETEWVLRYTYELSSDVVHESLRRLMGLARLEAEDRDSVLLALALYAQGLDLADALHLASSRGAESFLSFDRPLAKAAARSAGVPPVQEP